MMSVLVGLNEKKFCILRERNALPDTEYELSKTKNNMSSGPESDQKIVTITCDKHAHSSAENCVPGIQTKITGLF